MVQNLFFWLRIFDFIQRIIMMHHGDERKYSRESDSVQRCFTNMTARVLSVHTWFPEGLTSGFQMINNDQSSMMDSRGKNIFEIWVIFLFSPFFSFLCILFWVFYIVHQLRYWDYLPCVFIEFLLLYRATTICLN